MDKPDEPPRVHMPPKAPSFAEGSVRVSAAPPDPRQYARRFYLDISEEALSKVGKMALEAAIVDLSHSVVRRYQLEIEQAVFATITDRMNREWVEPILKEITVEVFLRFLAEITRDQYYGQPGVQNETNAEELHEAGMGDTTGPSRNGGDRGPQDGLGDDGGAGQEGGDHAGPAARP